jgi:hypothetical protein
VGKALLKLISIDVIISAVIQHLAKTVKNPESEAAKRLVSIVRRLNQASGQFLWEVNHEAPNWEPSDIFRNL